MEAAYPPAKPTTVPEPPEAVLARLLREEAKSLRAYLGPGGADFTVLVAAMENAAKIGAEVERAKMLGESAAAFFRGRQAGAEEERETCLQEAEGWYPRYWPWAYDHPYNKDIK